MRYAAGNSEYVTIDDAVSSAALDAVWAETAARGNAATLVYSFGFFAIPIAFFLGVFLVVTARKLKPRIIGIVCVVTALLSVLLLAAFVVRSGS